MASISFNNNFFDNWFKKPPNPLPSINLLSLISFNYNDKTPNFSSLSISNPFKKPKKPDPEPTQEQPGYYKQMLDQYFWECENLPDYRHTPEVEKILNEDPIFEKKENPTPEEIEENEKWWAEFRASPVVQFLTRAHQIADKINEMELKANSIPYRWEDRKFWQALPHVIGPDGRPMPRKAIITKKESDDKFWDFARQFLFGLWGRQRPYPPVGRLMLLKLLGLSALRIDTMILL